MNKEAADFLSEVARLHFNREPFQFGKGGELPKYAKTWQRYNFLQRLRGIRLEQGLIIAENEEGKETLRVKLPKLDNLITHNSRKLDCPRNPTYYLHTSQTPLLPGDYYGVPRGKSFGAVVRWTIKDGKWKKAGIAVRLTIDTPDGQIDYWEHGKDKKEVEAAYLEKCSIVERKRLEYKQRDFLRLHQAKIDRVKRLIVRLCNKMVLEVKDAKEIGYCNQGIMDYCKSFGFKAELAVNDGNGKDAIIADTQFASALKATKDYRALRLIEHKAQALAIQIIERRNNEREAKVSH